MRSKAANSPRAWPWVLPLFTGLVLLNSFLVSPFIGWYDTGEMVGTTVCLGISHPSGQVLFHLLGKVFLLLPWGTPAWKLAFLSAVLSSLASCLFFLVGSRLMALSRGPLSGWTRSHLLLLTLCWSLSLPWWRYSLTPLVYALHILLGTLLVWVLGLPRPGKWYLAALVMGTATVFRPTQFFALPFVGLLFLWEWWGRKDRSFAQFLRLAPFFALGRSTALYLPLRSALHPPIAFGPVATPLEWFRHVFALKFSKFVGTVTLDSIASTLKQMALHAWNDLTLFGVLLLLAGLFLLFSRRDRVPGFLWVALGWGGLEGLFVFTIPYPTFESHQTLLGWVFAGWLACLGLGWLEGLGSKGSWGSFAAKLLLPAFLLAQLTNAPALWEKKKERGAQDYAQDLLTILEPKALYVPTEENEYFPVVGYQQSFGFRGDVEVLEPGTAPDRVRPRIEEALREGRPLYVTRTWALPPPWGYQPWGPLLKVVPAGMRAPVLPAPKTVPLASWGGLDLVGVGIVPQRVKAGGIVEIHYQWVRRRPSPQDRTDLVVGLFIDRHGSYWMKNGNFWFHDLHEPAGEGFAAIRPGTLREEKRVLFIPSDFPPGDYAFSIGLQRVLPPKEQGQEAFDKEFYERTAAQDLDKFMGRGEGGAVVQFSMDNSRAWKDALWPATRTRYPIADPRFVPASVLTIEPND
ncbi:MAG TPA: DUF2723 domain-containing protein [bacterium]|nr:DUF2723 domain-containing protein [bacterium]